MKLSLDHIVLNIKNEEAMITFYLRVLLLSPERLEEYYAGRVPFPSVRLNQDTIIDLFPKKMWQKGTQTEKSHENLNHFCITMGKDMWDNLIKRLETDDTGIEEGPVTRWGAHGTGTSIYFRDPDKNLIEARYYES